MPSDQIWRHSQLKQVRTTSLNEVDWTYSYWATVANVPTDPRLAEWEDGSFGFLNPAVVTIDTAAGGIDAATPAILTLEVGFNVNDQIDIQVTETVSAVNTVHNFSLVFTGPARLLEAGTLLQTEILGTGNLIASYELVGDTLNFLIWANSVDPADGVNIDSCLYTPTALVVPTHT